MIACRTTTSEIDEGNTVHTTTQSPPRRFDGPLAGAFRSALGSPNDEGYAVRLAAVLAAPDDALPVAPRADRATWGPTGSADRAGVESVLARGRAELGSPWVMPRASDAARFHADGDRTAWEDVAFERQRRLSRVVVGALTTDDDAWLVDVLDGVWALLEQNSWCWPAHDDTRAAHGTVLADERTPFLDLGAGELVAQLAWIDHVLGADLEARWPGTRARIRREAERRVFTPFTSRRDWHWLGLDGDVHNWSPWIQGNVLVAALRLLDGDLARRAEVVALAIEGIDRYVAALPDDGAIDEGYAYWWNGACRALEALGVLAHATGGALDASTVPALRQTVAFPHRMHLGGEWYLNLADGQARPPVDQPWHALHRAARAVGDGDAAAHAAAHRTPGSPAATEHEGLGRLLLGLTDPAWVDATPDASPLPRDVWLGSTEVLVAREHGGTASGLTLAAKGGHNDEHHNHNDVGSFVVASDGVPVVVDLGRPTYTAQTFSPRRYEIWTMQSGWHNVPIVAGVEQPAGRDASARDVAHRISGAATAVQLELAGAYPADTVGHWTRTATFDREAGAVHVDDAFGATADRATECVLVLAGTVHHEADGVVVTPLDGARPVRITWTGVAGSTLESRDLDDPMLSTVWGERITRLRLTAGPQRRVRVTVRHLEPTTERSER